MTDLVERRDLYIAIARLARIIERQQHTIDELRQNHETHLVLPVPPPATPREP
jgi:hypothetical protein